MTNVQLVEPEPDSDGGSNSNLNGSSNSNVKASRVPLFMTVRPATDDPRSGLGLELIG